MNVIEIVKKYIEENKADGLVFDGICSCLKSDLMPCDNPSPNCQVGVISDCSDCDSKEYCEQDKKCIKPIKHEV